MDMGARPYALASEEGQAVWFLGTLVIMKATGDADRRGLRANR